MSANKMHHDEVQIDKYLVKQLLRDQFPDWADLELEEIHPSGTDNMMYKLGDDKVIRLPRMEGAALNIEKEIKWLPKLSPLLPITIPVPLGKGMPSNGYPFHWLICQWLEGKNPITETALDHNQAAKDLGEFVKAMQRINLPDGPECRRGLPLMSRDEETREAINLVKNMYDDKMLTDIWESSLAIPMWERKPTWIHGDLHAGNMLAFDGRVSAIVDFGSAGVGDPASDLMVAWTLLTDNTRDVFRSTVNPDDATWYRARAWTFTFGIVAYPYYKESHPVIDCGIRLRYSISYKLTR